MFAEQLTITLDEQTMLNPMRSRDDLLRMIHVECNNGSPSHRGDTNNDCLVVVNPKVLAPAISSRMEQCERFAGFRISTRRSITFPGVARSASQCEVFEFIPTAG